MKLIGLDVEDFDDVDMDRVTISTSTVPMASLLANMADANWFIEVQPIQQNEKWITTFKRGNSDNGTIFPK
jgi:hypothetical protein